METAVAAGSSDSPGRDHWSFQPLVRPALPATEADSPAVTGHPIDRFVARRYRDAGVPWEPEADRRTLLRRLSFDLRGLPPSPAEMAEFLADTRPDAWSRWVETFLASPQYGERWGRHWLDVAAYADSNGYFNADSDRPLAWKYRDYVVRSIQQDKPFNQFILEQVAGDESVGYVRGGDLTPGMREAVVATQFLRNVPDGTGESDGNPLEVKVDKYTVLEGAVQLIGNAFLGLTLQCGRCHEHKFEPVTQEEYYGLQAILRPALDPEAWLKPNERAVAVGTVAEREARERAIRQNERDLKSVNEARAGLAAPFRRQWLEESLERLEPALRRSVREALDRKESERSDAMKQLLKAQSAAIDVDEEALGKRFPEFAAAIRPLRESAARLESSRPPSLEKIAALHEPAGTPPAHRLLKRGNHAAEGPEIPPGIPVALSGGWRWDGGPRAENSTTGRRLALARWLVSDANPLVTRVLVNRVWAQHFGEGLVTTADNLGRSGARPSDAALLDWLACEFRESGWSLKHLHRLILGSAVWRQRSRAEVPVRLAGLVLPGPRRLEAEALRDAMLHASGELDLSVGGPYVPIQVDPEGQVVVAEGQPGARRRSIYLQQRRTQPPAFLQVFDGPAHNPVCVQRVPSTVALQSLAALNSEFVRTRARAMARRVLAVGAAAPDPTRARCQRAFEWAYGRPATPAETRAAAGFVERQVGHYAGRGDAEERGWTDFCQGLLASNEFLYVD